MTNAAYLSLASGATISRTSSGSLYSDPTFSGTVNLNYTGASAITAGKELPTGTAVINNLTSNAGGLTQYAYNLSTTNILTEPFATLGSWTGNIGTGEGYFNSNATTNAGGTSPEVRFTGDVNTPYTPSNTTFYIYRNVALNTTGYSAINVSFKTMSSGNYTPSVSTYLKLQSSTSTSGPWHDIWSVQYSALTAQTITIPNYTTDVGGNMYFQFAFVGDYDATDYWYFDNLVVDGVTITPVASNITINGTLDLKSGAYTIGSGNSLTMASGKTITRSGGSISAAPAFTTSVNVNYDQNASSITTGPELPTGATLLTNLTINSTNNVVLNANATVNGTLNFSPRTKYPG